MQKTSITSSFEMSNSCQNLGGTAWSSSAGSTVSIAASFRKADPRTCGSPTTWSLRSAAQAATALAGICTHRRAHTLGSNDGSGGSSGCPAIFHQCLLRLGTGCLTSEASIAAMVSQFGRRHLPHSIHLHGSLVPNRVQSGQNREIVWYLIRPPWYLIWPECRI